MPRGGIWLFRKYVDTRELQGQRRGQGQADESFAGHSIDLDR